MDVKILLEKYNLTQQELADFTGIPRGRIQKWIEKNIEPPKTADIQILNVAANFFANIQGVTPKEISKTHRIYLNNVVTLQEYEVLISQQGTVNEPVLSLYEKVISTKNGLTPEKEQKKALDSSFTKKDKEVLHRFLGIWEESNANIRIIATALDKFGDSQKSLSESVHILLQERADMQHIKKARAGS